MTRSRLVHAVKGETLNPKNKKYELRRPCKEYLPPTTRRTTENLTREENAEILERTCRTPGEHGKGCRIRYLQDLAALYREVFNGVGADGVGVKFPIFAVHCCCLPLSFRRRREKRRKTKKSEKKAKKCVKKRKMRKKGGKSLRPHLHQPH